MRSKGVRSGAEALVEALERAGAEVVFGYPGANIVDVYERLQKAKFRFVLGRHEQGCTHMADGYARATGRPGVVVVTSGPGATNAITGLATANVDGVPLVLISGQVPLSQIGTDAFQEADMTGICRGATKHSFLVQHADEIPETVAQAFYIATHGKPGAVVIDVPKNVQEELTGAQYPERISLRAYHPEQAATTAQVNKLAKYLNEAKRPVLYAGGGVIASNAAKDVAALAKRASIPVATTLMGVGSVDEQDPLALGLAGMYGTAAANAALRAADVIIALGVRFNDRVTGDLESGSRDWGFGARQRGRRIVHVDCDPSSIDKNVSVELGIVADIKDLLTTVNSRVKPNERAEWLRKIAALKRRDAARPEVAPYRGGMVGRDVPARRVIESIYNATKGAAILVADIGLHQMWCARYFRHSRPRHFLTSGGMGTMGFAIPAAIGAAIAKPDHQVVAVVGDGGAQMTGEELIVAVEERLPIVFVVVNNRALGMVNTPIASPDFVKLAEAHGMKGVRVADPRKLDAAIAKAVRSKGPILVEVVVADTACPEVTPYRAVVGRDVLGAPRGKA